MFDLESRSMGESFLYGVGDFTKDEILAASMLHDYIEDQGGTYEGVKERFNENVAKLVVQCTRLPNQESKKGKYEFLESFYGKETAAILIKIADRYCNVKDYYRTPGKEKYASTYALQAYPLYHVFFQRQRNVSAQWPLVVSDIKELQLIINEVFNVDVIDRHLGWQHNFVETLVT
jgi:(p)ppGpp synthase/HD superfamily hydrolase